MRPGTGRIQLTGLLLLMVVVFVSGQDPAELVDYTTDIDLKNGQITRSVSFRLKINNRAGDKHGDLTLPYSPILKLDNIRGALYDATGKPVRKLRKSDIEQRSLTSRSTFYSDQMCREMSLRYNRYPYYVEYSYRYTTRDYIQVANWYPVIDPNIPTRKACLRITADEKEDLRMYLRDMDAPDTLREGSRITYSWETGYPEVFRGEALGLPVFEKMKHVSVVAADFHFDIPGSCRSWTDLGDWLCGLTEGLLELPGEEKAEVARIVESAESREEAVRRLYQRLQDETRYVNIMLETGGLKPYPAGYVSENKYGDCKALSNYFIALLKEAGIPAHYTLVNAGTRIEPIIRDFPSQQFNHVIVAVPLDSDTLWIDCTSKCPFGYVGTFIQNRYALVIEPGNSHISRVPALGVNDVTESLTYRFRRTSSSSQAVEVISSFRGEEYEDLFAFLRQAPADYQERFVNDYYMETGFDLTDFFFIPNRRDSAEIGLLYKATTGNYMEHFGGNTICTLPTSYLPDLESPAERKMPVRLDFPLHLRSEFRFTLPGTEALTAFPEDQHLESDFGEYHFSLERAGDEIIMRRQFVLEAGQVELDQYPLLFVFIQAIRSFEKEQFIVTSQTTP